MSEKIIENPDNLVDATDSRLIENAARGDLSSFETLYKRHLEEVVSMIKKEGIDDENDVEDLNSDIWTSLHTNIGNFVGIENSNFLHKLEELTKEAIQKHLVKRSKLS